MAIVARDETLPGKGGGRLNRSETVTVRLDPKLNYLCELAARSQRRTKSSFIEWAIANSLGDVTLPDVVAFEDFNEQRDVTLKEKALDLWHVDEADRVAALALIAPALLTHEEQIIWKLIRENGLIWRGRFDRSGDWTWEVKEGSLIKERLREYWDTFKAVANDEKSIADLPRWPKHKDPSENAFDDDVPF